MWRAKVSTSFLHLNVQESKVRSKSNYYLRTVQWLMTVPCRLMAEVFRLVVEDELGYRVTLVPRGAEVERLWSGVATLQCRWRACWSSRAPPAPPPYPAVTRPTPSSRPPPWSGSTPSSPSPTPWTPSSWWRSDKWDPPSGNMSYYVRRVEAGMTQWYQ